MRRFLLFIFSLPTVALSAVDCEIRPDQLQCARTASSSGITLVAVDATGKYLATVLDRWQAFIKFEKFDGLYGVTLDNSRHVINPTGYTYFTDLSCGLDGGKAFVERKTSDRPFWNATGWGQPGEDQIYIANEGGIEATVTFNSFLAYSNSSNSTVCTESPGGSWTLAPAVPVAFSYTPPITLDLR